ncbi:MAG: CRTAC1 family protein [Acidobacteria bacterium]|nr:CRTAC1 family protein [Acidobacteriota bacterium]
MNSPSAILFLVFVFGSAGQPQAQIRFVESAVGRGLDATTFSYVPGASPRYILYTNGTGVGVLDYDGDGRLDVIAANGADLERAGDAGAPRQLLWRQTPGGLFEAVASRAGIDVVTYGQGFAVGDIDDDGWRDIYLSTYGRNRLFRNLGDGTFEDVAAAWGVDDRAWGTSAVFADFNGDGRLDLYVARYLDWHPSRVVPLYISGHRVFGSPSDYPGVSDRLYINDGNRFVDASRAWGLSLKARRGLGVVALPVAAGGPPSIVVANDGDPNDYWLNQDGRRFSDEGLISGLAFGRDGEMERGMGIDAVDYDGDGIVDVAVANFEGEAYSLYRGVQPGLWTHRSYTDGIGAATRVPLGFGANFADLDSDGWPDLFFANGHVFDNVSEFRPRSSFAQTDQVFRNTGGKFELVDGALPADVRHVGRASAVGDVNGDGALDVVVTNINGPVLLYENVSNQGRVVVVRLTDRRGLRNGIGARLRVTLPDRQIVRWVGAGGSFLAANGLAVHLGLGDAVGPLDLEVTWPLGGTEIVRIPASSSRIWIHQGAGLVARSQLH